MKTLKELFLLLIVASLFSACNNDIELSIKGQTSINEGDFYEYKALFSDDFVIDDTVELQWSIKGIHPKKYTKILDSNKSILKIRVDTLKNPIIKLVVHRDGEVYKAKKKLKVQKALIIDGYRLPADPGEEGKETIKGIDANKNGVRDDVERAIYLTYKRPIERAYMMQDSLEMAEYIERPLESAVSESFQRQLFLNSACASYLEFILKIDKNGILKNPSNFQDKIFVNTKDRIKAYAMYNQARSGTVSTLPDIEDLKASACDFNVTELLNREL